jgi:hypothetical protein
MLGTGSSALRGHDRIGCGEAERSSKYMKALKSMAYVDSFHLHQVKTKDMLDLDWSQGLKPHSW